jgi:hypothetical protein
MIVEDNLGNKGQEEAVEYLRYYPSISMKG